jgi:diacylglycerol kinase family enzyme
MKISGKSIYSIFLAKKFLAEKITNYKFRIDANEFQDEVISSLILINNQPMLANTFEIAPLTNHTDGTFNVTIFKHTNRIELIKCLVKILLGTIPTDDSLLITFETTHINIDLLDHKELSFFGDGEIFPLVKSWEIKIHPEYLSVFDSKILQ